MFISPGHIKNLKNISDDKIYGLTSRSVHCLKNVRNELKGELKINSKHFSDSMCFCVDSTIKREIKREISSQKSTHRLRDKSTEKR